MPAVSKRSTQKNSWNKAIAYDPPAITTIRKAKSGASTGLHGRLENNARATALQNKSNVMQNNSRFMDTPMKKPGTSTSDTTIKKLNTKPVETSIKKPTVFKLPKIEFDNGELLESYPPKEEMYIAPKVEDEFEDLIPKEARLDNKDLARIGHLSGFFMQSPETSDDDDNDDDWKLDVMSMPLPEFSPLDFELLKISEEEEDPYCFESFDNVPDPTDII